ncbi:hypothetical protein GQX73_g407 [Xylaria multiplex]|uniref:Rhodopsin domain-containing protein n=1 Tax=Xylaria multiplex TaxID=323545 RepID=A0A7C8J276_9PEZI|nr:hypothetical protein GQX73_g407 [Xylaria multiplex]
MSSPLPPDESRKTALEVLLWTEFSVSTVFIFLRLATRHLKRSLGLDDVLMVGSWLFFLGTAVAVQFGAQASGGMRHQAYLTVQELSFQLEISYVVLAISIVCTALGKIAIGTTILRIVSTASSSERWVVWAVIVVTTISSIIDIFISLFQCGRDPRALWDFALQATTTCLDAETISQYTTFTAVWQAFADFVFSILPVFIVWRLRMSTRRKLILTIGLGLTLLTGGAAAAKSAYIARQSKGSQSDFTWDLFSVYVLLSTEALLIIMCGSIPSIYPMFFNASQRRPSGYPSHESGYRRQGYRLSRAELSKNSHRWWPHSRSSSDPGAEIPSNVEIAMLTGTPLQPPAVVAAVSRRSVSDNDDLCYGKIHVVKEVELSTAARGLSERKYSVSS